MNKAEPNDNSDRRPGQDVPMARRGGVLSPLMPIDRIGERVLKVLGHIGSITLLTLASLGWVARSLHDRRVRLGMSAIVSQIVRVGVRAIAIISLVSACVGLILALQMAPPLDEFGRRDAVANIVGIAVLRELGPLIASIVLTGFAGAAIAAEIGTMVVGEEVEALQAHALNPVRFLVVPRVVASVLSMTALAVIADVVAVGSSLLLSMVVLDIPYTLYMRNTLDQIEMVDFVTGIMKATIFGLLIGAIACGNGLGVTGGAAGVGKATTGTVVESIVAIIVADLMFTAIFYSLGLV